MPSTGDAVDGAVAVGAVGQHRGTVDAVGWTSVAAARRCPRPSLVALAASSKNWIHSSLSSPSGMSKRPPPGIMMYS
jgi:hypothetical protein